MFVFSSCIKKPSPFVDNEKYLSECINNLFDNEYLSVKGTICDGEIINNFECSVSNEMKQAILEFNDKTYYFFGKFKFEGDGDGIKIVDSSPFESLIALTGSNLLNFKYDKNNVSELEMIENTLMVRFVGIGASYSFATDKEFKEGSLSVIIKNRVITKTVFSAKYLKGQNEKTYTCIASYKTRGKLWDNPPKVLPSNDAQYANFLLSRLALTYPVQTFRLSINGHDTKSQVGNIPKEVNLMSKVLVIGVDLKTITITYKENQLIVGVDANIKTLTICYDDDYNLNYMIINNKDREKYTLS